MIARQWLRQVLTAYRNDSVMSAAAEYIARRGGFCDAQRDDVMGRVGLAYAKEPGPILAPARWGRSAARNNVMNEREFGTYPTEFEPPEPGRSYLIGDLESLKLATRRKALAELGGETVLTLDAVRAWGDARREVNEYFARHAGEPPRRLACMSLMSGHWPAAADFDRDTAAAVIEGVWRRINTYRSRV